MDKDIIVSALMNRYQIDAVKARGIYDKLSYKDKEEIMKVICTNKEQRELEQVSFTYQIPVSLAVLTHLTRHRMHSLLIPDFIPMWDLSKHIVPNSIKNKCLDVYEEIYDKNTKVFNEFKNNNVEEKDLVYFYLSGHKVNVTTNINGRTLEWISRMRCCNKAQWEIRNNVNEMVRLAKDVAPIYGKHLGATCDVYGYCPEGKECCGKVYTLKKGE
jgi:thymidylate synthase (FAD)